MITAVIVLSVVALALGGYIAFDILHSKKNIAGANPSADIEPSAPEVKPQAAEDESALAPELSAPEEAEDAAEPAAPETEPQQSTEPVPEQVTEVPVADEPQADEKAVPTVEEKPIAKDAPKASDATDEPQAEKKTRRSRYKDPDIVFTEELEKGRHKVAQKREQNAQPQAAPPAEKKKPTKPATDKKPTKPTAEKKTEQQVEQKAAEPAEKKKPTKPATDKKPTKPTAEKKTAVKEPKAVEPKAAQQQPEPKAQSHVKEEKNKIAQNISDEAAAVIQRGDEAVETKPAVESKVLPPDEVRAEVTAIEVDTIMSDEVAESLIEQSDMASNRTKQGIINIDTLSRCFDSGERVTLDGIKKRVQGFNKKTTYIKVLARGTLDKALTVEADSFSLQAVKMIVLTGGKVIKKH